MCNTAISPAQVRRVVTVDGVTDTVLARPAALLAASGSGGGRKALPTLLPSLPLLQPPGLLLTLVTVRQALGTDAWAGAHAALSWPLLHSVLPVTTEAKRTPASA